MSRALITLGRKSELERAMRWIAQAPPGTRLEFKKPVRTIPQNDLMWARLTVIATAVKWHGQKLSTDDWKDLFTGSIRKARMVPNIEDNGFVMLGLHTSDMSVEEMTELLDFIDVFAAQRGITWPWDTKEIAA